MIILGVVVASVAAFIVSGAWYAAFGSRLARLHPAYQESSMTPATIVLELTRSALVAIGIAFLGDAVGIDDLGQAVLLGVGLTVFPVAILSGSVLHERVPLQLAAIHTGDWIVKLPLISTVIHLIG